MFSSTLFNKKSISPNTCLILFGHACMLIFIFFSIYLYAERVLYYDSAFQSFKLINSEWYSIEADRWSTILVQTLPIIFIKLDCSLKTVLIIYSFSYILIGYIVFIINVHFLKNTIAGIAVVFLYTLCTQDSFYYCVTELPIGMLFTTTFYAWLLYPQKVNKKISTSTYIIVALFIQLICFFFHPMTFLSIIFIIGFVMLHPNNTKKSTLPIMLLFLTLLYSVKMFFTDSNSYEGNLFGQLKRTPELLPQLPYLNSMHFFTDCFWSLYALALLLIIAILTYYAVAKKWMLLSWLFINVVGFLLICFIAFNEGNSYIAMEKYFMPLSLLVALPLLHDIFSIKKIQFIGLCICIIISSRGICKIYVARTYFTDHLKYIGSLNMLANDHGAHKFLMYKKDINEYYTTWACGTETLLLSALNNKAEQTTVYLMQENELSEMNQTDSLFLCVPFWRNWSQKDLNKKYFNLPFSPYTVNSNTIPLK